MILEADIPTWPELARRVERFAFRFPGWTLGAVATFGAALLALGYGIKHGAFGDDE